MNINRENYEVFFLDYHEGVISKEAKLQLIAFLKQNPDLKEEFDNFENISLKDDNTTITFNFKESLKQENNETATLITFENYHEFLIAATEGDLSQKQQKQLDIFLSQNAVLFNEFQLYKKLKLEPDFSIIYDRKNSLKRFSIFNIGIARETLYQTASIAASILLFAGISSYYFQHNNSIDLTSSLVSSNRNTKEIVKPLANLSIKNVEKPIIEKPKTKVTDSQKINSQLAEIQPKILNTENTINQLAKKESNQLASLQTKNQLQTDTENRMYYMSVLDFIAMSEENINTENNEETKDKINSSILTTDLIKDQPIAEAGIFIKNAAIVGFSKIEAISSDIKDTYLAFERRIERR